MTTRRKLLFSLLVFITDMLIIFRKVSANNTEIRKIRTWRLNITDSFTKPAKDKLDIKMIKVVPHWVWCKKWNVHKS